MKIPCGNCIILAICKAKSQNYDHVAYVVSPSIYTTCISNLVKKISTEKGNDLLYAIRNYLRPDLKLEKKRRYF